MKSVSTEIQNYRFEPLNLNNKKVWFETAFRCAYAPFKVFDDSFIDQQLRDNRGAGNVIIYDRKNDNPVALFPGEIEKKKISLSSLNILKSWFGGLLVVDDYFKNTLPLRIFAFKNIINSYYRRSLKIDSVEVTIPPKFAIESPSDTYQILPFYGQSASVEINSMLYTELADDILNKLKPNVRREISKGLENIKKAKILSRGDKDILKYIVALEKSKAGFFKKKPIPENYFQRILKNSYYYPLVALLDGQPVTALIYTYCNGVGTFHFNANARLMRKSYINKALCFIAMDELKKLGAKYFVLGAGREYSEDHTELKNIAFFKRSLSTHEIVSYRFMLSLTYKAHIKDVLKQRKLGGMA